MTRAGIAVLLLCVACGARTPLEGTGSNSGAPPPGGGPGDGAPGVCASWQAGEPTRRVSSPYSVGGVLGAPVAIDGSVLAGWYEGQPQHSPQSFWSTLTLGFDGAPRGDIQAHPGLTVASSTGPLSTSLAVNGGSVGALVGVNQDATGCRFLLMNASGAELGPVVPQVGSGCNGLGADGDGFSFLAALAQGKPTVALHRVDAHGVPRTTTMLPLPANRDGWDRLVLDDGSFLVSTYSIVGTLTTLRNWLQSFDASGVPLAMELALGESTVPAKVVATSTGVLVGLEGSDIRLIPLDRRGAPAAAERSLMRSPVVSTLRLFGTANGDVLVFWGEFGTDGLVNYFGQVVTPDGNPRAGAMLILPMMLRWFPYYVVIDASGRSALFIEATDSGLVTVPLACVH